MSEIPAFMDAVLDVRSPSDVQLSPDGKWIAFVLGAFNKPDAHTPHLSEIQLLDLTDGKCRVLEAARKGSNRSPRWSPDGRLLAFLTKPEQEAATQLHVTDLSGEVSELLSAPDEEASAPAWQPDGTKIACIARPKREPADPLVVDAAPNFARLMLVSVGDGRRQFVSPPDLNVHEFAISPAGDYAAILASDHPNPMQGWYHARLHLISLATHHCMELLPQTPHQIGRLSWSPNGEYLAFVSGVCSDEGNVSGEVYVIPQSGGEPRNLTPAIDHSITWIDWREAGILYGARHIEAVMLAWLNPEDGSHHSIFRGEFAINGGGTEAVSAVGMRFAPVRESFSDPPQMHLGSLENGESRPVSDFAYPLDALPPIRTENRYWQHADGTPTHAYLAYPNPTASGEIPPMVANVHGGPSLSIIPRYFSSWVRVFLELGCTVLLPNPRGSWGRGHAYQAANVGDLGGGDWQDIMAGIDALVAEGTADANRLAIMGWSYAGFLSTWAVTQTDRFRCSIAGANITNYVSNYGVVLNREWQSTMFGSNVYDDMERHWSRSPIRYVDRVRTPTLLVHGAEDIVAPPEQSVEFYTALQYLGVPSELVLYPREPHGIQERAHQLDLMLRMRRWLQQYLLAD